MNIATPCAAKSKVFTCSPKATSHKASTSRDIFSASECASDYRTGKSSSQSADDKTGGAIISAFGCNFFKCHADIAYRGGKSSEITLSATGNQRHD